MGHKITVFLARFHHLLFDNVPLRDEVVIDGIRYVPIRGRFYKGNGVSRMLNTIDYSLSVSRLPSRVPSDFPAPDVIIVSSPHPFAIWPAARLARRYNAQLTFEVRDLWPLSLTEISGTSSLHPYVLITALTERFAYRRSDLVASLLGDAESYMRSKGLAANKFVHVPNGIAMDKRISPVEPATEAGVSAARKITEWKSQGRVILINPGAQGRPNALDKLIEAAALLKSEGKESHFGVLLIGKGTMTESLVEQAKALELDNIAFASPIPKSEVLWLISQSDIGYSGARNLPDLYRYGTSFNKRAEFMEYSIPVILTAEGPGDPVTKSGCGIVTGSDKPQAIARAIDDMVAMTPKQRAEMGIKGRQYVLERLNYDRIACDYIKWIEKTMRSYR